MPFVHVHMANNLDYFLKPVFDSSTAFFEHALKGNIWCIFVYWKLALGLTLVNNSAISNCCLCSHRDTVDKGNFLYPFVTQKWLYFNKRLNGKVLVG